MTPPVASQSKSFWPYLLTIIVTAIIAVGLIYWLTKPANDTAAQPTASSAVVSTDITAAQAEVAVQSIITDKTVHVRYDHMSTDNTKYIVQAFYDYGDHVGTQGWYRVDKASGVASLIDTAAGETE